MKKRTCYAMMFVGFKGTGKSTKLCRLAKQYAIDNRHKGKRVLIIDVNGSPAYKSVPSFTAAQVRAWTSTASTRVAKFYSSNKEEIYSVVRSFRGGLVILEDCTKWIKANPPDSIREYLVDHRMWNADLVFTFHSLSLVPPFFWQMTSHIVLMKTQEPREWLESKKRIPNLNGILSAYDRIQASPDPYASELIETRI